MNHIDVGATSRHTGNIEEEDMILSEGHHGLIVTRIWRFFNVYPLERSAIGSFQETHV